MKKAIFGGTFDPIHIGHINIAYEALYNLTLDKVIFMPNGNPPHKTNKIITPANIRYEMVQEAIKEEQSFEISDYEMKNNDISYTYKTLQHFNEFEKDTEWYFLTGVDSLMDLNKWKNVDIILEKCNLVVFSRPGFSEEEIIKMKSNIEKTYNKKILYLNMSIIDVSSTGIKQKLRLGRQVKYLLPCGVQEIVDKYILYR